MAANDYSIFCEDFKNRVHRAIELLDEANKAIRRGEDPLIPVMFYNSAIATIQKRYGGEWWIFRQRAFAGGFKNEGFMDSREGAYNPFRLDAPKKKKPLRIKTENVMRAMAAEA